MSERDGQITERDAGIAQRDAALAERDAALAEQDAALAQRDAALGQSRDLLAQKTHELQQALAQAAEVESGQADLVRNEQARREIAALLAGVAERERAVAERESHLDHALAQTGEALDLEARAQWLTDAVKTAARQEAETVLKEARDEARRILDSARLGRPFPALPDQPD